MLRTQTVNAGVSRIVILLLCNSKSKGGGTCTQYDSLLVIGKALWYSFCTIRYESEAIPTLYLSTFISGLQEVIGAILAEKKIRALVHMLDGAVVYESDTFLGLECFNNTFEVLDMRPSRGRSAVLDMFNVLIRQGRRLTVTGSRSKRLSTFRVVASDMNSPVSVPPQDRAALEQLIQAKTGLTVNRVHPQVEYWVLSRSEGLCFFLRRVTNARVGEKQLAQGALRPELTYVMNWLTRPQRSDVFADPFCGSGAILLSRAKHWGFFKMYGSDISAECVQALRQRIRDAHLIHPERIELEAFPVWEMAERLPAGTVTRIVTDPPWGLFERIDIPRLYASMLRAFSAACAPGARIVLLTARKAELETALAAFGPRYTIEQTYHILVSGKKAALYCLTVQ